MKSNLQKFGITTLTSAVFMLSTFLLHAEGEPVRTLYKIAGNSSGVDETGINKRATRDFVRTYPAVNNANWYHAKDGGWLAIFEENSVRTVVAYNRNGVLHHTIKYFDEKNLPKDVRAVAKSTYFDFKINRVADITLAEPQANEIYLIYMESDSELKEVTISAREIVDVKTYQKGG